MMFKLLSLGEAHTVCTNMKGNTWWRQDWDTNCPNITAIHHTPTIADLHIYTCIQHHFYVYTSHSVFTNCFTY